MKLPRSVCDQPDREVDEGQRTEPEDRSGDECDPDDIGIDAEIVADPGADPHHFAVLPVEAEAADGRTAPVAVKRAHATKLETNAPWGAKLAAITNIVMAKAEKPAAIRLLTEDTWYMKNSPSYSIRRDHPADVTSTAGAVPI